MIKKIIEFLIHKHLLINLICIIVIVGGIFSWQQIKKEEYPDITFDRVRISANYPGATAEEVEHFVTKEIEASLQGVDGIYQITSNSGSGSASITVELEKNCPNKDEVITEIKNAVLDTRLPDDIKDEPRVRVFKTSKKAIIDVAIYDKTKHLLDVKSRKNLQKFAISLENQLINLSEINSVNRSGYLDEQILINADPVKLEKYKISLNQIISSIKNNHIRMPAGSLEQKNEPKVTISAELNTVEKLNKLYIQAGFEGQAIALSELADTEFTFSKNTNILKVNGHEAIMLNVVKNGSYGILESLDVTKKTVENFKNNYFKNSDMEIIFLDDESFDIRNRLSIIVNNGLIGFVLILITLFLFLSKKAGLWVAFGIPFTFCFTLIVSYLLGYSINNITLAAVIIVMGIVVDDAIVVAENITRFKGKGFEYDQAVIEGTSQVFLAILGSILTTCIAFIPLFFFSGRFGQMNRFIPPIIFLMLGASLFESLFILPGHLNWQIFKPKNKQINKRKKIADWFYKIEDKYEIFLNKILPFKYFVFLGFILLLAFSFYVAKNKMKFVMFPNEETREIVFSGETNRKFNKYETAEVTKEIENIIKPYIGKEVVGIRTQVARSRRGKAGEENKFRMIVEIVSKENRDQSADELSKMWKGEMDPSTSSGTGGIKGLEKIVVQKSRWGQSSGSAIEVVISENNDKLRLKAAKKLAEFMKTYNVLKNVEIEKNMMIDEYKVDLQREKVKRLSINPSNISTIFRAVLEGKNLYELPNGDENIDVKISVDKNYKKDINTLLNIPVENNRDYLVPLKDIVIINKIKTPTSISRKNGKRITTVYADINEKIKQTPLEIAKYIEETFFPKVIDDQPSTALAFSGEVFDTRESKQNFKVAIYVVLFLIFATLVILFNSITRSLLIMLSIPFGIIGVILAFWAHSKLLFGFFAGVGCLGLAGVVVNDAIVMVTKLDYEFRTLKEKLSRYEIYTKVSKIAKTRLKAVILTTLTTVAGVMPTAYGLAGYDAMLSEMMLALAWGLIFATVITLILVPCIYSIIVHVHK